MNRHFYENVWKRFLFAPLLLSNKNNCIESFLMRFFCIYCVLYRKNVRVSMLTFTKKETQFKMKLTGKNLNLNQLKSNSSKRTRITLLTTKTSYIFIEWIYEILFNKGRLKGIVTMWSIVVYSLEWCRHYE